MSRSSIVIEKPLTQILKLSKDEVIKKKTKLQDEYVNDSLKHSYFLYKFFTGFGKSRTAKERINKSNSNKQWLILVPKTVLIEGFLKDYKKWGGDLNKIKDVICYDSLGKYENTSLNILCDEGHHVTDLVLSQLEKINSDEVGFLSATISSDVIDRVKFQYPKLEVYNLPLIKGIKLGIVPPQDIRKIEIPLKDNDIAWKQEVTVNKVKKEITCSSKSKYNYLENNIVYWKERYFDQKQEWIKFKWLQAALQRKNWMAEFKIEQCKKLLRQLDNEGKRYICFVNSVQQSKELGGKNAIHSKQKAEINQQLINKFNNFEIDTLFSKDILTEGVDLSSIECSVFLQLDGSEGKTQQKMGRTSARAEFPIQYVFIIPDTRDEEFFNDNFSNFREYITKIEL